jgi:hypothetical protein
VSQPRRSQLEPTENLLEVRKEIGIKINSEEVKYVFTTECRRRSNIEE